MAYQITNECNGCGACAQWCPTRGIQGRKKQKYSILPEKCIECGACGRICPRGAVLDAKGNIQSRIALANWLKPEWDYARCDGCGICVQKCPTDCMIISDLQSITGQEIIQKPYLFKQKLCISCGFCARECKAGAIEMRQIAHSQWIYL